MRFLAILFCYPLCAAPVEVSANGPVSSLAAARDKIRELRRNGDTRTQTVVIRGGTYRLPETFQLAKEDSGVTYAAASGERVVISGGRRIEGWKKGAGPIW